MKIDFKVVEELVETDFGLSKGKTGYAAYVRVGDSYQKLHFYSHHTGILHGAYTEGELINGTGHPSAAYFDRFEYAAYPEFCLKVIGQWYMKKGIDNSIGRNDHNLSNRISILQNKVDNYHLLPWYKKVWFAIRGYKL